MTTLLQFDFPFDGPFGAEMTAALAGLAQDIAAEEGLIWKLWTENEAERRAGGIYLFADAAAAERYADKHKARLEGFGVGGIVARSFAINADLSAITRAPL
ncbi:MAG: monooxygenase [Rhizobium sp.]|nr:monooxygenase [Rhizobium sp.]